MFCFLIWVQATAGSLCENLMSYTLMIYPLFWTYYSSMKLATQKKTLHPLTYFLCSFFRFLAPSCSLSFTQSPHPWPCWFSLQSTLSFLTAQGAWILGPEKGLDPERPSGQIATVTFWILFKYLMSHKSAGVQVARDVKSLFPQHLLPLGLHD